MRVDRQAIIDAVAEKSIFHATAIGAILEAAGHFELVEAVCGSVVYECERCEAESGTDSKTCNNDDCPHTWVKRLLREAGVEVE